MKKGFAILLVVAQLLGMLVIPAAATQASDVRVVSRNIVLNDGIGANFCLNVPQALAAEAVVNVTVAGQTTAYALPAPNADGYYRICVPVAAAQMTQDITLQLVTGEAAYAMGSYTVRDYALTILEGAYDQSTKAMVQHMLNYGAAAQQYFGIATDSLANAGYELAEANTLPEEYPSWEQTGALEGVAFHGATLVTQNRIAVRYYFDAQSLEGVTFTANGSSYSPVAKDGSFYVEIGGIMPQDYAQSILLCAQKDQQQLTVSYSPMTYIGRMSQKGSANTQALVNALYGYHAAAMEYANRVQINLPAITGGTVTADKEIYYVGDTVNLTITPDAGNVQKLYINGESLLLDYATGQYSFVATEPVYDITGSFEAEHSWFWTADWNLINQGHGIAHAPAHTDGERTGELVPQKGLYNNVSVLFKDASGGEQSQFAIVLKMLFTGGKQAAVRLIDRDDNGKYCLQAMGDSFSNWSTLYWLTEEENTAVISGQGVWYSMVRLEETIYLRINEQNVTQIDLTAQGLTAETALDQLKIQSYNFGYAVDIPYAFSMESAQVDVNIPALKNGSVTADKVSYTQGETVSLTVTPRTGYSQQLYINGEPLLLPWQSNTYQFVAVDTVYEITGAFVKNVDMTTGDIYRWDTANHHHGVLSAYYPTNQDSNWMDIHADYQAITIWAKNYLPTADSMDSTGNVGYCQVLRVTLDNGNVYAFRIINDKGTYAYQRYGAGGSLTGWDGWKALDSAAVALLTGEGVAFKLERTAGDQLTLSVNGVVMETYTMDGVTEDHAVSSVSILHTGNQGQLAQIPYALERDIPESAVTLNLADPSCGAITAHQESYELGDTVVLTVQADAGYYHNGLYVNGQLVTVEQDGTYGFTATETVYDVEADFSVGYWAQSGGYNLINQNTGVLYAPATDSETNGWLESVSNRDGVRALIRDPAQGTLQHIAVVLSLKFANGGEASARLVNRDGDSKYHVQVFGTNLLGSWSTLYSLSDAENEAVRNGDGVWYSIYREGAVVKLAINDTVVTQMDLSAQGITADMTSVARINSYNFTYDNQIPYSFVAQSDSAQELVDVMTYVDGANELFFRNFNISNLPDPFVLDNTAIDGYYYLYGTWGAIRCLRSRNLMDWELRGEVLYQWREDNKVWDSTNSQYSYGILGYDMWAPEVIYDPDTQLYYMFFSASPTVQGQSVKGATGELLMVATCDTPDGDFVPVNFKDADSCGAENVHTYSESTYSHYYAPYLFLDPAENQVFSTQVNKGEWRGALDGREGYVANIDPHPYIAPDGTKYLFWVDGYGPDRICGMEMENWLKPKWETATLLLCYSYYTVEDYENGVNSGVSHEYRTTTNEGPFVIYHEGKYYMTYSANNWKNNTYLVAQAISDSVLGPYTKLKESQGGVVLSGVEQGGLQNTGTGHHSILSVGQQLYMVYHRHTDPYTGTYNDPSGEDHAERNHAIDEIQWITVNGQQIMYVNGPSATLQPRVEAYSQYRNIAQEATLTGTGDDLCYLNDGLLSHLKNGATSVINVVGETVVTGTSTFTFTFEQARTVRSIMVYNSRLEAQMFRNIAQIKLVCLEDGQEVTRYINGVPFNAEYYTTDDSGAVTYVEPCAAAYAVFDALQVLSVEITVRPSVGQSSVGISEIRILGE